MNDPGRTSQDPDELVTVYTVNEPTHAELIRNDLEGEGIRCEISGENQAGLAGVLQIQLLVRAADAPRAREILSRQEDRTRHSSE